MALGLFGVSARRMLKVLADGKSNPAALAALANQGLPAAPAQLADGFGACGELNPAGLSPIAEIGDRGGCN